MKKLVKHGYKKIELKLEILDTCQCGFKNFYVWGTRINGITHIEVRCISCGRKMGF